ncbi:MAG: hypothetical protein JRG94_00235 [Deltaproteobacteria bacterium]|nr:hypothetical protein [Deltaproteobacteria bacterium]
MRATQLSLVFLYAVSIGAWGCTTANDGPGATATEMESAQSSGEIAPDTFIDIERTLYFADATTGSLVALEPGQYTVEQSSASSIRFTSEDGSSVNALAEHGEHAEHVGAPFIVAEETDDDEVHVVILQGNGQTIDAVASYSGVVERGSSRKEKRKTMRKSRLALRQMRPSAGELPSPRPATRTRKESGAAARPGTQATTTPQNASGSVERPKTRATKKTRRLRVGQATKRAKPVIDKVVAPQSAISGQGIAIAIEAHDESGLVGVTVSLGGEIHRYPAKRGQRTQNFTARLRAGSAGRAPLSIWAINTANQVGAEYRSTINVSPADPDASGSGTLSATDGLQASTIFFAGTSLESSSNNYPLGADCDTNFDCSSGTCDFSGVTPQRCIPRDGTGKIGEYCTHPNHCGGTNLVCVNTVGIWMGEIFWPSLPLDSTSPRIRDEKQAQIEAGGVCAEPSRELGDDCGDTYGVNLLGGTYFRIQDYRSNCISGRCDLAGEYEHHSLCIPHDFAGRVGDYCTHNNQCSDRLCGDFECRAPQSLNYSVPLGGDCFGFHEACQSRTCDYLRDGWICVPQNGYGQVDDPCTHPNQCASTLCSNNTCQGVGPSALGDSCSHESQCVSGRCDTQVRQGEPGRCIPNDGTGIAGDYCSHHNHCIDKICSVDEVCVAAESIAVGDPCTYNQACQSGRCDDNTSPPRCIPVDGYGQTGEYCTHDNHCASVYCGDNRCSGGSTPLGDVCADHTNCVSRRCDGTTDPFMCIPNDGTGVNGDYCTHHNQCRPGSSCNVFRSNGSGDCRT